MSNQFTPHIVPVCLMIGAITVGLSNHSCKRSSPFSNGWFHGSNCWNSGKCKWNDGYSPYLCKAFSIS